MQKILKDLRQTGLGVSLTYNQTEREFALDIIGQPGGRFTPGKKLSRRVTDNEIELSTDPNLVETRILEAIGRFVQEDA